MPSLSKVPPFREAALPTLEAVERALEDPRNRSFAPQIESVVERLRRPM